MPSTDLPAEHRSASQADRFVGAVAGIGLATTAASIAFIRQTPALLPLVATVIVLVLGDLPIVHVRHGEENHTFTWSEASIVAGLVLLPTWWLPAAGGLVVGLQHAVRGRTRQKVVFNATSFAIGAFLATIAHEVVADHAATWAALGAACSVYFLWNTASVALAVSLSLRTSYIEVLSSGLLLAALFSVANTSIAILIAIAAAREPVVLLTLPPVLVQLIVAYRNTREVIGERDLWVSIQRASEELQRASRTDLPRVAVESIAAVVDAATVECFIVQGDEVERHRYDRRTLTSTSGSIEALADDIWGRVECDRASFWLDGQTASPRQRAWLDAEHAHNALVLPLEWGGSLRGAVRIAFNNKTRRSEHAESILSTVCTQIASAVTSHQQTERLQHQAEHDQLTSLPNRARLTTHLEARLDGREPGDGYLAVLFFDLDGFKVVNDSLGHHIGDQVLLEAAQRLSRLMRPGDIVARFGGDEFVVVCDHLSAPEDAEEIATRLLDALSRPAAAGTHRVPISASVGIACLNEGTMEPDALLRDADAAMYQAKLTGPGSSCLFTAELRTKVLDRLHLEADLRDALSTGQIEVHYQPVIDVRTGQIREFEALARWDHPERGAVSPEAFIRVAEDSGQIRRLSEQVLNTSCRDMRRWLELGLVGPDHRVAVNLSPLLLDSTLPAVIGEALVRNGLPPSALTVEVTESALVDDPAAVTSLEQLRSGGVRVSLDDFGTGFSSLSALRDLPVDNVKIDRSFTGRLGEDPELDAMVEGIVGLAHALKMSVIAEGVEHAHQAALLASFNCDQAQGWLHGRAVSAPFVEMLLAAETARDSLDGSIDDEARLLRSV